MDGSIGKYATLQSSFVDPEEELFNKVFPIKEKNKALRFNSLGEINEKGQEQETIQAEKSEMNFVNEKEK